MINRLRTKIKCIVCLVLSRMFVEQFNNEFVKYAIIDRKILKYTFFYCTFLCVLKNMIQIDANYRML